MAHNRRDSLSVARKFLSISLSRLATALIVLISSTAASLALDSKCTLAMGGYGFSVMKLTDGTLRAYRISSTMERRILAPNHYHSTVYLSWCDCPDGPTVAGAISLDEARHAIKPDAESMRQSYTIRGSVMSGRTFERGIVRGEAMPLQISSMPGWAIKIDAIQRDGVHSHDIVEIAATDGCLGLYLTLETTASAGTGPIPGVAKLLAAIRIEMIERKSDSEMESALHTWAPQPPDQPCEGPVIRMNVDEYRTWIGSQDRARR